MAVKKINKEESFQIPAERFIVSASSSGYTLNYSADGNINTTANNGRHYGFAVRLVH